ncbi:MOSC domain protein [Sulfitobacter noctilucicola]|uniref:MOSC domain-containing protein n=1 Tax=Sulfitobacter noctilucicola TaxID=1342301 RepID=A0A7W6M7V1_9RHOB|nr:MOSC N-terminal beta barrel domain-containing protein [Sulfitobacter noctilucicola]KIN62219.1 MOSC domain protein [Sulfitobacter noctilucicola]MBB4173267.1 hypothetical protein [Sulfitobacter noctilucicola]
MQITALYRHPIKSHGRESLDHVTLIEGQSMPFDRRWAVAHEAAKVEEAEWVACANFSRGSKAPLLMAVNATLDEASGQITLTHPDRPTITVHPTRDEKALIDWVMPLVPQNRALPAKVVELPSRGYTDSPYASLSLCNTASHAAVETLAQTPLSPLRWRGNIWFDGVPAWEEFGWVDRDVRLGAAVLRIKEPIVRCLATTANPETGERDVDTLRTLNILGHQNFGIYAEVITGGAVAVGDSLEIL